MSRLIIGFLIYPCISASTVSLADRTTEVVSCPDTVKYTEQVLIDPMTFARYQHNFFRLQNIPIGPEPKIGVK